MDDTLERMGLTFHHSGLASRRNAALFQSLHLDSFGFPLYLHLIRPGSAKDDHARMIFVCVVKRLGLA
jgi:hypothetical protein